MRIPHIPPILQICCIYFRRPDSIYLLHSDKELIKIVKATILQWWKLGLQRYRLKDGAHQFKLNGLPFAKSRKTNPVHTRLLCANLLKKMLQNGWMLLGATEMSRKSDQTVWLFQRMEIEESLPEVKRIVSIATMHPNTVEIEKISSRCLKCFIKLFSSLNLRFQKKQQAFFEI